MQDNWLTVNELSSYINLKEKTIYHLVSHFEIPHYRIGKLIRFKKEEIDTWLRTKSIKPLQKQVDKILSDIYTPNKGRPGRLKKEVTDGNLQEGKGLVD